jgi:hypothetical protein
MTYCQNCGHESHCEIILRKMVDCTQIEICKSCRCVQCESDISTRRHNKRQGKGTRKESWPGPGV